ncbi:hypothetical protein D8T43_22355 [Vibrio vulnificus]|nr:hypothetical protein D8T43_22355 [Vibrio vulnificus]
MISKVKESTARYLYKLSTNSSFIRYPQKHNAQLRGEQRYHPHLKHCAINTKTEVEAKVPSVVNPS